MGYRDDVEAGQYGAGAETMMNRCDDVLAEQTAHSYTPEMGGKPDTTKLFQRCSFVGRWVFVDWSPEREEDARELFKRLKIRPKISYTECRDGSFKWTGQMTGDAWRKLRDDGNVSNEALLD